MTNENVSNDVHLKLSEVLTGLVKISVGNDGHFHGGHFDDTYLHRLLDLTKSPPAEIGT